MPPFTRAGRFFVDPHLSATWASPLADIFPRQSRRDAGEEIRSQGALS